MSNRFLGLVKKGVTAIEAAYRRQKAQAEQRARRRMKEARTRLAKERAMAELELERLRLQRELYEAKAAVAREKERLRELKRREEKGLAEQFFSGLGALLAPAPKRRAMKRRRTR